MGSKMSNRFKKIFWALVMAVAIVPVPLWANVHIYSITLSTALPAPGGTLGVTVTYCEDNQYNTSYFLVALEPSSHTTIQACPYTGQRLLVDGGNPAGPAPVLTSTRNDGADPGPTQGWNSGDSPQATAPTCPASTITQVFVVTIPSNTPIGNYNLVVAGAANDVQCTQWDSTISKPFAVSTSSEPPSLNISKSVIGNNAQGGDLILFRIDYNFINTGGPVTITDPIPPAHHPGRGSGSQYQSPGREQCRHRYMGYQ